VIISNGEYPWSYDTQIFRNGESNPGNDRQTFEVMTLT
jgi:hypothetical protein